MFTRGRRGALLLMACVASVGVIHIGIADENTLLPSLETRNAIRELPVFAGSEDITPQSHYLTIHVNRDNDTQTDQAGMSLNFEDAAEVPFVIRNSMILQFEPIVSAEEVRDYVRGRNLKVVQTFPEIGAIQVEVDLRSYVPSDSTGDNPNQELLTGLVRAIDDFQSDPLIRVASPDPLLNED